LRDHDRALQLLEQAYSARVSELVFIGQLPELDGLRSRFVDLLRRIGFPAVLMPDIQDLGSATTVEQVRKGIEKRDR